VYIYIYSLYFLIPTCFFFIVLKKKSYKKYFKIDDDKIDSDGGEKEIDGDIEKSLDELWVDVLHEL
jgi:hypothetical protein